MFYLPSQYHFYALVTDRQYAPGTHVGHGNDIPKLLGPGFLTCLLATSSFCYLRWHHANACLDGAIAIH